MHHHPKFSLSSSDSPSIRGRSLLSGRSQSPATSSGTSNFSGHSSSPAHASNGLLVMTGNGHTAFPGSTSGNGNIDIWAASSNIEGSSNISNNGFEQSQCCYHCNNQQQQQRHCSHSTPSGSNSVMLNGIAPQTIEDQIRAVDKFIKVSLPYHFYYYSPYHLHFNDKNFVRINEIIHEKYLLFLIRNKRNPLITLF